MQKARFFSLMILILLSIYLAATALFAWFFRTQGAVVQLTRTPAPTFTPVPTAAAVVTIPTQTPTLLPTVTLTLAPTPTPPPTDTPLPPTNTPTPARPQVVAANVVNVRGGPGTNYPVITQLPANLAVTVVGRNNQGSWWQIQGPDDSTGWVAGSVVQASNVDNVPVVAAPPPPVTPTPTFTPVPPKPQHQFEPTGWFNDTNLGLTRFLGNITDAGGGPVNGVYVRAQCGDFSVISNPSGSTTWPPGFYDITLGNKPIACQWHLTVVATDDQKTVKGELSEAVLVETTIDKSIVTANWRKNW